ncbi:predicted protein [Pyrenophora tritici-repentis Pt-1C-BFP]|uniref:Uncharacterized protein n=1 Tax=Pyrenophora tritici-repentis (strain Pt-1C-BFP) TaxID=426418 RepID=B2WIH3_PYRTR|nr:uncharacterized protein PTRG_09782 [Pyrenophora tritici-repentis Pt-1C-BFP]EDU42833.1 predicted protein [Pyrenophora tritici-repentis Pt-1C-BFP]
MDRLLGTTAPPWLNNPWKELSCPCCAKKGTIISTTPAGRQAGAQVRSELR